MAQESASDLHCVISHTSSSVILSDKYTSTYLNLLIKILFLLIVITRQQISLVVIVERPAVGQIRTSKTQRQGGRKEQEPEVTIIPFVYEQCTGVTAGPVPACFCHSLLLKFNKLQAAVSLQKVCLPVCLWLTAVTLLNAYIKPPWLWSGVIRVYITSSEPLKASLLNHWVIKRIVKEMWSPAEGKRVEFLDLRHLFGLTSLPQSNTKNVINRICLNAFYI